MIGMPYRGAAYRARALLIGIALGASGAATPAEAQLHAVEVGGHVLRANVVRTENVSDVTLQQHGIETGPNRALLNVVVLSQASGAAIPALVEAEAVVAGYCLEISMKPIVENGGVSYWGGFAVPLRSEEIRFWITAKPTEGERLRLSFTDRLPAHQ